MLDSNVWIVVYAAEEAGRQFSAFLTVSPLQTILKRRHKCNDHVLDTGNDSQQSPHIEPCLARTAFQSRLEVFCNYMLLVFVSIHHIRCEFAQGNRFGYSRHLKPLILELERQCGLNGRSIFKVRDGKVIDTSEFSPEQFEPE
jgi:hypothetical protein